MLYRVKFLIDKDDLPDATLEEFEEWVKCELTGELVNENNTLEFNSIEVYIQNLKIEEA